MTHGSDLPWLAAASNFALLVPVFGAFVELMWRRAIPSLAWPFVLLAIALAARIVRGRTLARERPALLGVDGVLTEQRFVAVTDITSIEEASVSLFVELGSGERLELRANDDDIEAAASIARAIRASIAAGADDDAAARVLADAAAGDRRLADGGAYRVLGLDASRCIAVALDAAAEPRARIAAARLLEDAGEPDVRLRLAEAAERSASPEVRAALLGVGGKRRA